MKQNRMKKSLGLIAAILCCLMVSPGTVYADTDGTELQVAQPMTLEIQLGQQWAGVEFQLKTDTGVYPGSIIVGEDGILRTELGGSTQYTLSCLNSAVAIPSVDETQVPATTDPENKDLTSTTAEPESDAAGQTDEPAEAAAEENTVGGIPIKHIIFFGGGILLAVGGLTALHIVKKRRESGVSSRDDEEDDDY